MCPGGARGGGWGGGTCDTGLGRCLLSEAWLLPVTRQKEPLALGEHNPGRSVGPCLSPWGEIQRGDGTWPALAQEAPNAKASTDVQAGRAGGCWMRSSPSQEEGIPSEEAHRTRMHSLPEHSCPWCSRQGPAPPPPPLRQPSVHVQNLRLHRGQARNLEASPDHRAANGETEAGRGCVSGGSGITPQAPEPLSEIRVQSPCTAVWEGHSWGPGCP